MMIYIVEDDKNIQEIESFALKNSGYEVRGFECTKDFYAALDEQIPDLVLLDIMLPDEDGLQILKKLRLNHSTVLVPVIMVTAKTTELDKVKGLDLGADDYLTKPFYREELIMRVKALLKRSLGLFDENILKYKDISCDLKSNEVLYKEQVLPIQGKEFELLVYFLQNKGIILTKEQIFDRIWGFDSDTTITVVEVYMSNLRKHLRSTGLDKEIKTLRNVGYILQGV